MRFTIKSKLARAFGAIIILSAITGGVAYVNLSDLAATSRELVNRADRIDKAGELQALVLYEVRAEKNVVLANEDAEITRLTDEIKKPAGEASQLRDAIFADHERARQAADHKFSSELREV